MHRARREQDAQFPACVGKRGVTPKGLFIQQGFGYRPRKRHSKSGGLFENVKIEKCNNVKIEIGDF
jgi:hypothetical protein